MRPTSGHKLAVAFAVSVAVLAATATVSYREGQRVAATTDVMLRSQVVLRTLEGVLTSALDAESGSRAYALLGTAATHAQFERARLVARGRLARLDSLAEGDTALFPRSRMLRAAAERRLLELGRVISLRDSGEAGAAAALVAADGRVDGVGTRRLLESLIGDERANLAARTREVRAVSERAERTLGLGILLALSLATLAFFMVRSDLAARRATASALAESEGRFRAAADGSMDAFYVLRAVRDHGGEVVDFAFADLNARAGDLLGLSRESVLGRRLCDLIPANRADGYVEKYRQVMESGVVLEEELELSTPQLHRAWIRHQVVPMPNGVAITSRDVTERRSRDEALRALSLVDELTGLHNRRGFLTLAQQQLKLARRGHRELLLLFIDMDDFKEINDGFGHGEGDDALRTTARILRSTFRDSDVIGRIGGDEFVVLATDAGATTTSAIVDRLRRELQETNASGDYPYRLSFSVGAARFDPDAPPSIEELIAAADSMLYEQKKHKRRTTPAAV